MDKAYIVVKYSLSDNPMVGTVKSMDSIVKDSLRVTRELAEELASKLQSEVSKYDYEFVVEELTGDLKVEGNNTYALAEVPSLELLSLSSVYIKDGRLLEFYTSKSGNMESVLIYKARDKAKLSHRELCYCMGLQNVIVQEGNELQLIRCYESTANYIEETLDLTKYTYKVID